MQTFRLSKATVGDAAAVPDHVLGMLVGDVLTYVSGAGPRFGMADFWQELQTGGLILSICVDPHERQWSEVAAHAIAVGVSRDEARALNRGQGSLFGTAFWAARVRHVRHLPMNEFNKVYAPPVDARDPRWKPLFDRSAPDTPERRVLLNEWNAWPAIWVTRQIAAGWLDAVGELGGADTAVTLVCGSSGSIGPGEGRIGEFRNVRVRFPGPARFVADSGFSELLGTIPPVTLASTTAEQLPEKGSLPATDDATAGALPEPLLSNVFFEKPKIKDMAKALTSIRDALIAEAPTWPAEWTEDDRFACARLRAPWMTRNMFRTKIAGALADPGNITRGRKRVMVPAPRKPNSEGNSEQN
jgi:hypothetical protein